MKKLSIRNNTNRWVGIKGCNIITLPLECGGVKLVKDIKQLVSFPVWQIFSWRSKKWAEKMDLIHRYDTCNNLPLYMLASEDRFLMSTHQWHMAEKNWVAWNTTGYILTPNTYLFWEKISADNILKYLFKTIGFDISCKLSPLLWHFMQIVSIRDNLHDMSK